MLLLSVGCGGAGWDGFEGEGVGRVGGESRRTVDGGVAVERGVRVLDGLVVFVDQLLLALEEQLQLSCNTVSSSGSLSAPVI